MKRCIFCSRDISAARERFVWPAGAACLECHTREIAKPLQLELF